MATSLVLVFLEEIHSLMKGWIQSHLANKGVIWRPKNSIKSLRIKRFKGKKEKKKKKIELVLTKN